MKLKVLFLAFLLTVLTVGVSARTVTIKKGKDRGRSQKVERTVAVDSSVTVSICLNSGSVTVQGWDKDDVTARAGAGHLELKRTDAAGQSNLAKKIEVIASDKVNLKGSRDRCQAVSDLELSVPRNASVYVKTRDGDIEIADVRMAIAGSQTGDISIRGVSNAVEVGSVAGRISLRDSMGRTSVTSVGGGIEILNMRPLSPGDLLEAVSVSGDVILDDISHTHLNARTVTGNVHLTGSLARGGRYEFRTMSGDVVLTLPSDSSFNLSARISHDGEIVTDFPLTLTPEGSAPSAPEPTVTPAPANPPSPPANTAQPTPAPEAPPAPSVVVAAVKSRVKKVEVETPVVSPIHVLRRVSAICGEGGASISVASFSGTLHLQKKD